MLVGDVERNDGRGGSECCRMCLSWCCIGGDIAGVVVVTVAGGVGEVKVALVVAG